MIDAAICAMLTIFVRPDLAMHIMALVRIVGPVAILAAAALTCMNLFDN